MRTSIVLCTFNGAQYLDELLQSINQQSVLPDEMVISDDASSDETIAILEDFAERQPFTVRIFKSAYTRGVNENHEYALRLCTGDLIFIADQDDIWNFNKIQLLSEYANKTGPSVIFSNAEIIDHQKNITQTNIWEYFKFDYSKFFKSETLLQRMLLSNVVTGSTLVINKDLLECLFPFPATDKILYDEWLALIIAITQQGNLIPFNKSLMKYRFHDQQYTNNLEPPMDVEFPFNWDWNYRLIKRKQHAYSQVKIHIEGLGKTHAKISDVCNFWNLRLTNFESFSFYTKLQLSRMYIKGKYHNYTRWPSKSWIKDLMAWQHDH